MCVCRDSFDTSVTAIHFRLPWCPYEGWCVCIDQRKWWAYVCTMSLLTW